MSCLRSHSNASMLLSITAFLLTVVNFFHEADAVITYSAAFPSAIHHVRGRNSIRSNR